MPRFNVKSQNNLYTCHADLIQLFTRVVEQFDCTVLCGHRTEEDQQYAYHANKSKKQWPESMHNSFPSLAADVVAYPIQWGNYRLHYCFGGYVMGVASELGIALRWGGDWDGDWDINDQRFNDLVHFELVGTEATVPTVVT